MEAVHFHSGIDIQILIVTQGACCLLATVSGLAPMFPTAGFY